MAYFSSGTEGMDYEARFCDKCVHQPQESDHSMCPIWDVHMLQNYEQQKNEGIRLILSALIPRSADGLTNERCSFFQTRPAHLLAGKG